MSNKETLATAINQVLNTIRKEKEHEKVDVQLFCNNCIKEFNELDLPFYSISLDKHNKNKIVFEVPFLKEMHVEIEQYLFGSKEKAAVLYINRRAIRKIRLENKNPEYMKRVSHALLDYLKRFLILKDTF